MTPEVWIYQLLLLDARARSPHLPDEDDESLFSMVLSRPVDLLLPTPMLRRLLEQLLQIPGPVWDDLIPFSAHHLRLQADQIPRLPTGYLRGHFWFPTRRIPDVQDRLLIAVSSVTPDLAGMTPQDLLERWNTVFSQIALYLSYLEKKER